VSALAAMAQQQPQTQGTVMTASSRVGSASAAALAAMAQRQLQNSGGSHGLGGGGATKECDLPGLGVRPAEQFNVGHPSAKISSRLRCWITRSWRIVSHFARMWADGVGGILLFMEAGGASGGLLNNHMVGRGLMSSGQQTNRIMRMLAASRTRGKSGCWLIWSLARGYAKDGDKS
jgi:hypothetical protein